MISYITWNRLGLNIRNLNSLLRTTDDFELYIVDNNSKDDTWDYILSLNDSRIKSREKLGINAGPIYALNYVLAKRKPEQYFITLDSDVYIKTPDWITRFLRVFDTFPEVGLLGLPRAHPYPFYLSEFISKEKNGVRFSELKNGKVGVIMDFVPGHCQCLRPELIEEIGYWSEECAYGDAELSVRVNNYFSFKAGFVHDIEIDQIQSIPCTECEGQEFCKLDKVTNTCFKIRNERYKNKSFAETYRWKYLEFFNELALGKRTPYCASIHDPQSITTHFYNSEWAQENFAFYMNNAN